MLLNAVFAHDHVFYSNEGSLFSNGGLSYEVLSRYVKVFGEVSVVGRDGGEVISDKLSLASGEGLSFKLVRNFKSIRGIRHRKRAIESVSEAVKNSECVVARLPSSIGSMAIEAALRYGKPYLIEVVGCSWDAMFNHGRLVGKLMAPYAFLCQRRLVKEASHVIYITDNFLQSRYPAPNAVTTVCPNVSIDFSDSAECLRGREPSFSKMKSSKYKIGLIGSLDVGYKGHEELIRALPDVVKVFPNLTVEFLGKGNPVRWIKLAETLGVASHVKFVGTLPSGAAVYSWLEGLDLQVQPSLAEAQGRSIVEGMSRGCAVVASRVGGIVELIDSELLVRAKDVPGLSSVIIKILEDGEFRCEQSRKNYEASKKFARNKVEAERESFLSRFAEGVLALKETR